MEIRNRGFYLYVLLNIVTCGIYGIYFWYCYNEDINIVCEGDGEPNMNYMLVWLFSILTCGVYGVYWNYKQVNRLKLIASRYGLEFAENGTTILMWFILGPSTLYLSNYVVAYILIKNMNRIAAVYNETMNSNPYGGMGTMSGDTNNGGSSVQSPVNPGSTPSGYAPQATQTGTVQGLSGEYAGRGFKLNHQQKVLLGRDQSSCSIVFQDGKISKQHCVIQYNATNNSYTVIDYSSNGVIANGTPIAKGTPVALQTGTKINLGNSDNVLLLS